MEKYLERVAENKEILLKAAQKLLDKNKPKKGKLPMKIKTKKQKKKKIGTFGTLQRMK